MVRASAFLAFATGLKSCDERLNPVANAFLAFPREFSGIAVEIKALWTRS
jgi:hypothetical protein